MSEDAKDVEILAELLEEMNEPVNDQILSNLLELVREMDTNGGLDEPSVFASLFVDEEGEQPGLDSPIQARRGVSRLSVPDADCIDAEIEQNFPVEVDLINRAYQRAAQIYDEKAEMAGIIAELRATCRPATSGGARFPGAEPRTPGNNEDDKENRNIRPVRHQSQAAKREQMRRMEETITKSAKKVVSRSVGTDAPLGGRPHPLDPSLRRNHNPKPGEAAYRFDRVRRHQLYVEEWRRRPAPGENRRLSLRWAVREYMLRRDLPSDQIDPVTAWNRRVLHSKPWEPKPYLD